MKGPLNSFHLNGHAVGFYSEALKYIEKCMFRSGCGSVNGKNKQFYSKVFKSERRLRQTMKRCTEAI